MKIYVDFTYYGNPTVVTDSLDSILRICGNNEEAHILEIDVNPNDIKTYKTKQEHNNESL